MAIAEHNSLPMKLHTSNTKYYVHIFSCFPKIY